MLKVLEVRGANSYLIRNKFLNNSNNYYLDDVEITDDQRRLDLVINKDQKFEFVSKISVVSCYVRGDETMSIEEYRSKPQRYYEDSSDEDVLRAIANKKELYGFVAKNEIQSRKKVEFEVIGSIEDTGSFFISCSISPSLYSKEPSVFTLYGSNIALDEYKKLSEEYKSHATFSKLDSKRLRYQKINGKYAFYDAKPYNDSPYISVFTSLKSALIEEKLIRDKVRCDVKKIIFPEEISGYKCTQLISKIETLISMSVKKTKDELATLILNDLRDYESKINS